MVKEDKLIFLVSVPRSGSTLLQALLSNVEAVDTCSEPWIFPMFSPFFTAYDQYGEGRFDWKVAKDGFEDFLEKFELNHELDSQLKNSMLQCYGKIQTNSNHWVLDKTTRNYLIFDDLYRCFPKAKFILLQRDESAVIESILRTWDIKRFSDLFVYKNDIFRGCAIMTDLHQRYCEKENVVTVNFKDIINEPEHLLKKLYAFLGIETEANLNISENHKYKGIYGDPINVQHSQGIQTSGLKKNALRPLGKRLIKSFQSNKSYGFYQVASRVMCKASGRVRLVDYLFFKYYQKRYNFRW